MAAKLKSILERIHWSLLLKAVALSLAWLALPLWSFVALAVLFYLWPLFRPFALLVPFAITLVFAGVLTKNIWAAGLLAALFFLIFGIRDLTLINRAAAAEVLTLLILFLLLLNFFSKFGAAFSVTALLFAFLIAAVFFYLMRQLKNKEEAYPRAERARGALAAAIAAYILWQTAAALTFMPLNFFYQTAIALLTAAVSLEIFLGYCDGRLDRRAILTNFSIFFALLAVILASNQWGL